MEDAIALKSQKDSATIDLRMPAERREGERAKGLICVDYRGVVLYNQFGQLSDCTQ